MKQIYICSYIDINKKEILLRYNSLLVRIVVQQRKGGPYEYTEQRYNTKENEDKARPTATR